ncbi:MAG: aerial mycelium formation protein [Acidobacteriota bacterium]|nr:aerial mycelium formation protein [Acidobacteriota bacterium]
MAQLSEVTEPGFLEGLEVWPIEQVRVHRETATALETALSFLRRMTQGRLDIVLAERHQRATGQPADLHDLVERLPSILSGNVHAPGAGRLSAVFAPGEAESGLEEDLEEILPSGRIGSLPDLSDEELDEVAGRLTEFERTVSARRRAVLDVLDRLQDEIVRRYRTGEATVDTLLS